MDLVDTPNIGSSTVALAVSMPDVTSPKKGIPKRFVFTLLGFLSFFNLYAMRFNLSVAMVDMAQQPSIPDNDSLNVTDVACIELIDPILHQNSSVTAKRGEFDWDVKLQQLVLGSFYFGYVAAQIPFGIIAEKYHAKHCFGVGILFTALLTLLTPVAARYSAMALIAVRILQGVSQGASCPAINTLIGRWSPILERSRISTIIFNGGHIGTVISFALSGVLCDSDYLGGWPSVFYVFGTVGCLVFVLWTFLVSESPDVHPGITDAELTLIHKDQVIKTKSAIPWKSILTSIPVWGLVVTQIGFVWGYYTLLIETPIYLNNALHFDLKKNGYLSSVPIIISVIMGFLASIVADKLRETGKFHITTIRKTINSVGMYGSGLCMLLVAFAGCSPTAIIILLCVGMGLMGMPYSVLMVTYVDLSPKFCGTLMAIGMATSNCTGFLVPIFAGWILHEQNSLKNWGIIFITACSINVICGTVYNLFCSSELQDWQTPKEQPKTIPDQIKECCDQKDSEPTKEATHL